MFSASKQEVLNDEFYKKQIDEYTAKKMANMVARWNINTVIGWCKEMALKSRGRNNEAFAAKCDQVVSDMVMVYTHYDDMEKDLRVAIQRNNQLEIELMKFRRIAEQQLTVIGNLEKELGYG